MKFTSKQELEKIAYNHSSDIEFKEFINLYKNVPQNHIVFYLAMLLLHQ